MDNQDLLIIVAPIVGALAIGGLAFALSYPFFAGDDASKKRKNAVVESQSLRLARRTAEESTIKRRRDVSDALKDIDLQKKKNNAKISLRLRLERAGLNISPKTYWILSAVFGVVLGIVTLLSFSPSAVTIFGAIAVTFVGIFGLPRWILGQITKRRQNKFLKELANAMDVVVRGMKSGLPLNETLQIVARESPEPIRSEFQVVVEEQRVGVTLADALERLSQRMPLPDVRFMTIVIGIQQKAGGNLSEALGNLSEVLRDRQRMKMKVKALSAEALASAAVLASLPFVITILVYLSTPNYIMPLFVTKTGNVFVAGCLLWMSIGVGMMYKMINFKI